MDEDGGDFDPSDAKSPGFGPRIRTFVELMLEQDAVIAQTEAAQRAESKAQGFEVSGCTIAEQQDQMYFSALVIMFKVLKTIRLQDVLGDKPQERYLLAVACIAAANQCDRNISGRPLFMKSLKRASFIALNFAEVSGAHYRAEDYVGLMTYEDWGQEYFDLLIQIYHAVLQAVDLRLEVSYPIPYVAQAIPAEHPCRDATL